MENLSNFLGKFGKFLNDKNTQEKAVKEAFVENGINPDFKFSIKDGVVLTKTHPVLKTEIFMRKEKILKTIALKLPQQNKIFDIK